MQKAPGTAVPGGSVCAAAQYVCGPPRMPARSGLPKNHEHRAPKSRPTQAPSHERGLQLGTVMRYVQKPPTPMCRGL